MRFKFLVMMMMASCGSPAGVPCSANSDCASGLVCVNVCEDPSAAPRRAAEERAQQWKAEEQARLEADHSRLTKEHAEAEAFLQKEATDPELVKWYKKTRDDLATQLIENVERRKEMEGWTPMTPDEQAARLQTAYLEVGESNVKCRSGVVRRRTYIGCRYDDIDPPTLLWIVEGREVHTANGKAEQLLNTAPSMREKKPLRPRTWLKVGRRPSPPDVDIQEGMKATKG